MNPAGWIDFATTPPQRLPDTPEAALTYLGQALGHTVWRRWTLAGLKRGAPSLADAKRDHPAVFALLLDQPAAIEYWDRGRLRVVAEAAAPAPGQLLARVLQQHRQRFRHAPADGTGILPPAASGDTGAPPVDALWLVGAAASDGPAAICAWLARAGRFVNRTATNLLAARLCA
jgi:hypothetical protein